MKISIQKLEISHLRSGDSADDLVVAGLSTFCELALTTVSTIELVSLSTSLVHNVARWCRSSISIIVFGSVYHQLPAHWYRRARQRRIFAAARASGACSIGPSLPGRSLLRKKGASLPPRAPAARLYPAGCCISCWARGRDGRTSRRDGGTSLPLPRALEGRRGLAAPAPRP